MAKIHIVGQKYSFTYLAWKRRYGNESPFESHTHSDLVGALLEKRIPADETCIVPLWNSNSGIVDMDRRTRTAEIFLGKTGEIVDLWPNEIFYALGIKGKELAERCKIFSVKVASDQCSKFLKKISVYGTERFVGKDTTTDAGISFKEQARNGDGLLCSKNFLSDSHIEPKRKEVTNPYNMTIFSTLNSLPNRQRNSRRNMFSLGCVIAELNGNELPSEFIDYWQSLFTSSQAEESAAVLFEMPKIMFVLRYEQSKALLLLEMPTADISSDPWPEPEVETEIIEKEFEIFSPHGQVGLIYTSFTAEERELFINNFTATETEIIFYGLGETFIWAAPALNIFVHGFDPNLIKECARLQVYRLKSLMDYGVPMGSVAERLLISFGADEKNLKLDPDLQPDTP